MSKNIKEYADIKQALIESIYGLTYNDNNEQYLRKDGFVDVVIHELDKRGFEIVKKERGINE